VVAASVWTRERERNEKEKKKIISRESPADRLFDKFTERTLWGSFRRFYHRVRGYGKAGGLGFVVDLCGLNLLPDWKESSDDGGRIPRWIAHDVAGDPKIGLCPLFFALLKTLAI
jgi:hypothetical protein